MRKSLLAIAISMAVTQTASAAVAIDFDGAGPNPVYQVTNLDWNLSSFLADGGVTAITNFVGLQQAVANPLSPIFGLSVAQAAALTNTPISFDLYTHATLATFSGTPAGTPFGFNQNGLQGFGFPPFQITMIAGFGESVTGVTTDLLAGEVSASLAANPGGTLTNGNNPFIELYFHTGLNDAQDVLDGTGYATGTKMLRLENLATATTGNFTIEGVVGFDPVTGLPIVDTELLDQFGADNLGGQETVVGQGSQLSVVSDTVTFFDPAFFPNGLTAFQLNFGNLNFQVPFEQTDPSLCFNVAETTVGAGDQSFCDTGGGLDAEIGPINGVAVNDTSKDFIAQTDLNSAVSGTSVPEPTTLTLLGLGLVGMAARRRAQV